MTHQADLDIFVVSGAGVDTIAAVTIPERPVVDSNGAGDSFVAAFLSTVLRGGTYAEAALAGSIGGAWACGTAGTHTSFIDAERLAAEMIGRG